VILAPEQRPIVGYPWSLVAGRVSVQRHPSDGARVRIMAAATDVLDFYLEIPQSCREHLARGSGKTFNTECHRRRRGRWGPCVTNSCPQAI